jgi:hypothetical protein
MNTIDDESEPKKNLNYLKGLQFLTKDSNGRENVIVKIGILEGIKKTC